MHIVLFDKAEWRVGLYPLALTRPVADLRVGILTIAEKWAKWTGAPYSFLTEDYLQEKFPLGPFSNDVLLVRGNCCPDSRLVDTLMALKAGEALWHGEQLMALRTTGGELQQGILPDPTGYAPRQYRHPVVTINHPEDIFLQNGEQIALDFDKLTAGRQSAILAESNRFIGDRFFAEEGASAECATFNSTRGPIYLGKNSEVWEGSLIRGAFSLGENSQVKMGARIYSNVSVGPFSRVGGELNTCVIWGRSAKGHDGYLGSSVLGEGCNWGADTNNSNLKNNYKPVRLYDYKQAGYRQTGLQFCGMVMGDYVRTAINTAFNTGTVVGVGSSVYSTGLTPTFIPDFSWGAADGFSEYRLEKFFETLSLIYERRGSRFDDVEKRLLTAVFERTRPYRQYGITG